MALAPSGVFAAAAAAAAASAWQRPGGCGSGLRLALCLAAASAAAFFAIAPLRCPRSVAVSASTSVVSAVVASATPGSSMSGMTSRPASRSICSVRSVVSTLVFGPDVESGCGDLDGDHTRVRACRARAVRASPLRQPGHRSAPRPGRAGRTSASRTRPWRQGSTRLADIGERRRRRDAGQRDHADRGGHSRRGRGGGAAARHTGRAERARQKHAYRRSLGFAAPTQRAGVARRVGHEPPSLRAVSGRLHSVAWAGRVNGRKKKARSRGYWRVSGADRVVGSGRFRTRLRRLLNVRGQE